MFIKVFNPAVRNQLTAAGFNYITEQLGNGITAFVFVDCKEIRRILAENFADEKFIITSQLCF